MTVLAVVGGQFGSEGKGSIVSYLADEFDVHVRSGGPNAGHSHNVMGKKWVNQQVPVGWINQLATLVITPAALISLDVLLREMHDIYEHERSHPHQHRSIYERFLLDSNAGVILDEHHQEAGGVEGEAHKRYGSTGEGVGVARVARLSRDPKRFKRAFEIAQLQKHTWIKPFLFDNTAQQLTRAAKERKHVLLEGTQGMGLSLVHGKWPYVTNHDTTAAQLAADAGLAPQLVTDVLVVLRTFPIRVAGNSGPMLLEQTWEQMAERTGQEGLIEFTTVTKKPRRIGEWDWDLAKQAAQFNQPTGIALTFLDYYDPASRGVTDWNELTKVAPNGVRFVKEVESKLGAPVWFVGTGPDTLIDTRMNYQARWDLDMWSKANRRRAVATKARV